MWSEHKISTLNHTYDWVGEDGSLSQGHPIHKLIGPKIFLLKKIYHSFPWHNSTCFSKSKSWSQEGEHLQLILQPLEATGSLLIINTSLVCKTQQHKCGVKHWASCSSSYYHPRGAPQAMLKKHQDHTACGRGLFCRWASQPLDSCCQKQISRKFP